jgi:hypothetical protein
VTERGRANWTARAGEVGDGEGGDDFHIAQKWQMCRITLFGKGGGEILLVIGEEEHHDHCGLLFVLFKPSHLHCVSYNFVFSGQYCEWLRLSHLNFDCQVTTPEGAERQLINSFFI